MSNLDKLAIKKVIYFFLLTLTLQIFFSGHTLSQELPIKVKNNLYLEIEGSWEEVETSALNFCKRRSVYFTNVIKISERGLFTKTYDVKCIVAPSKNRPTSLEQRVLQSRKFKKSFNDVDLAVKNVCRDIGTNCSLPKPLISPVGVTQEVVKNKMGQTEIIHYAKGFEQKTTGIGFTGIALSLPFSNGQLVFIEFESVIDLPKSDPKNKIKFDYADLNMGLSADTTVRIRIKVSDGGLGEGFIFQPEAYSMWFKRIADQLFIDAIELSPAEMH